MNWMKDWLKNPSVWSRIYVFRSVLNKLKSWGSELINSSTVALLLYILVSKRFCLLSRFNSLCRRQDHHETVEKDCDDDDERKEWMNKNMDGHTADGRKGWKKPHGVFGGKSEDVFSFAYHNKSLKDKKNAGNSCSKLTISTFLFW